MAGTEKIEGVKIKNYGTLKELSYNNFQRLNLIIGENGTGKTFLLKALYTAMKTIENYKRGDDIRTLNEILAERLRWTFQTERIGDIVMKKSNEPLSFQMNWSGYEFAYSFSESTTAKLNNVSGTAPELKSNSIFIPAKEVLSLFGIILKSREVDKVFGFDDTYYDLAKALSVAPRPGKNYSAFAQSCSRLQDILNGKVDYDEASGKWFYRNSANQKFSIGATSEGVKKIAILDRLFANCYLTGSSIIFIDELESALHPTAVSQFIDMLDVVSQDLGIQIFIASHSYFVIKKLYLNALKNHESIPCISLGKESIEYFDLLEGMPENSIINESVRLYEEEIEEVLG